VLQSLMRCHSKEKLFTRRVSFLKERIHAHYVPSMIMSPLSMQIYIDIYRFTSVGMCHPREAHSLGFSGSGRADCRAGLAGRVIPGGTSLLALITGVLNTSTAFREGLA